MKLFQLFQIFHIFSMSIFSISIFSMSTMTFALFEEIQIQSDCCIHRARRHEMINHMELEGYTFLNSTMSIYNGTCDSLLYFESFPSQTSEPTQSPSHTPTQPSHTPSQSPSHAPMRMPTHGQSTIEPTPYLSYDLISI